MTIKVQTINGENIKILGIRCISHTTDNMLICVPRGEDTPIMVNGATIMRSENPAFDVRQIRNIEILL